jgi:hypothetical protein
MKMRTIILAIAMIATSAAAKETWAPDAEFYFSLPTSEREEIVELVSSALGPLGFGRPEVNYERRKPLFKARFLATPGLEVILGDSASCVKVRIYTNRDGKSEAVAAARAEDIKAALLNRLRAVGGNDLLLFQPDHLFECANAL